MPRTVTITVPALPAFQLRTVSAVLVPVLASCAAAACDWLIAHATQVTATLARWGVGGIFAAVLVVGFLPAIAKKCHQLEQSDPAPTAPTPSPDVDAPVATLAPFVAGIRAPLGSLPPD